MFKLLVTMQLFNYDYLTTLIHDEKTAVKVLSAKNDYRVFQVVFALLIVIIIRCYTVCDFGCFYISKQKLGTPAMKLRAIGVP